VEIIAAPVADAGEDQIVGPGELVTLDGSGSYDSSGDSLTYGWGQTGGPAVALSDSTAVTPTFVAPLVSGPISFTLAVTNTSALTDTDSTVVTVASADLALEKSVNTATPRVGDKVAYIITVTNHGPDNASGVLVSDTLPSGVTFEAHDGGYDESSGAWEVGALAASDPASLCITVTVDAITPGTLITNTAAITECSPSDPSTGDHVAHAVIAVQDPDAVMITVTPEAGGTLVYTDGQGYTTAVEIPAGAVSETLTVILTPLDEPTHDTATLLFAGHAFTLEVYKGPHLQPGYVFGEPVVITIHYSDEDVLGLDEETLTLEVWTGSGWEDAACDGYERHIDMNWLSVEICHLSEFALLGPSAAIPVGGATLVPLPAGVLGARAALAAATMVVLLLLAAAVVERRE
jgi:uncharacterized repeat protein (TIGR01451 family)